MTKTNKPSFATILTKEFLINEITVGSKLPKTVALEVGCSEATVRNYMFKHSVPTRTAEQYNLDRSIPKLTDRFLRNEYLLQQKSCLEISRELNCSDATVRARLLKMGIEIRAYKHEIITFDLLSKLYLEEGKTLKAIGEMFNANAQTVYNHCVRLGIPVRTKKQALKGRRNPIWLPPHKRKTSLYKQIRNCSQYKAWRKAVYDNDNYTCVLCGSSKGGNLNADHIIPFAVLLKTFNITTDNAHEAMTNARHPLWDMSNGRTLCVSCHRKTPTYGNRKRNKNVT